LQNQGGTPRARRSHNTTTITIAPGPTAEATAQSVAKAQKDVNSEITRQAT